MNTENIEMKPENFELTNKLEKEQEDKFLISDEESNIIIWYENYESGSKMIFLTLSNVTINMSEQEFYALTKTTQIATKKLLNID